jgi:hypothetical protein
MTYDLIKIGRSGTRLHALDPDDADGRAFCETRTSHRLKHRRQDGAGGYSDHGRDRWSPVFQTGKRGIPTCADCLALISAL